MSYSFRIHILSYKITEFNFYGIFCIIRSIVLINYFGGSEYAEEDLSRNCVQDSDVKHKKRKNNTADRNGRIRIFKETMDVCRKDPDLRSAIHESIAKQKITREEDPLAAAEERYCKPADLVITPERTFEAAVKYLKTGKRICALNFASSSALMA